MPQWAKKRNAKTQLAHKRNQNKSKRWAIVLEEALRTNSPNYIRYLDNAFKWEEQTGLNINEYSSSENPYYWPKTESTVLKA